MTYWQDFPDGRRRQEEMASKITTFFKSRLADAEEWDIAILRLTFSDFSFGTPFISHHAVQCWHTPSKCGCLDANAHSLLFFTYNYQLSESTLAESVINPLLRNCDPVHDSLDVLLFLLSLSDTSQRATELSRFIRMYVVHVFSSPTRH